MKEKLDTTIRDDFHSINNLLNKITTLAGIARYHLEENVADEKKMKEEKARLVKAMGSMEEYALNIGEILKKLRKDIEAEKAGNE
ncbi:MAG: hypothetical protein WC312_05860 [Candidatus Omnitrophota bacterium]|jgi:hypothetical protein